VRKPLIGAIIGVLALAVAGIALASEQFVQTYKLTYTTASEKATTGVNTLFTAADPGEANQTPKAARRVTITFHKGTTFDTTVPVRCNKTDQQVQASAAAGCPAKSKVGSGTAQGRVGDLNGAAADLDLVAYNANKAIIFLAKGKAGSITDGQNFAFRGKLDGTRLTTNVPQFPFNTSITRFNLKVIKVARGTTKYIRTPSICPSTKKWTTKAAFVYADGTTASRTSRSTCSP